MDSVEKFKYKSTKHVPWSREDHRESDCHADMSFFEGKKVVITEKMDGEVSNIYHDGSFHARSLNTPYHPSREWIGRIAAEVGYKLPVGWRICAENIYAKHSIKYNDLKAYVQAFSIWNNENMCLDWNQTLDWCNLLGIEHVPVIWRGEYDREFIKDEFTHDKLCEMQGREVEGYVMRTTEGFHYDEFKKHLAKFVRSNHVQTSEHWRQKEVEPNQLQSN